MVVVDRPRRIVDHAVSFVIKFWTDLIYGFGDIALFLDFGNLASKCLLWSVLGTFSPNDVTHRPNFKKDRRWAERRHFSYKAWISASQFEMGVGKTKNSRAYWTGHDRQKSLNGYISPIWEESPLKRSTPKLCIDLLDIITCVKSQTEILRGYDFIGGATFSIFVLIFEWAWQQHSAPLLRVRCMPVRVNKVSFSFIK